jgi:hypothetical protein
MHSARSRLFWPTLCATILTVLTAAYASAGEREPPVPKGKPPTITLASAREEGGEVVVRVSTLMTVGMARTENGKKINSFGLAWHEGPPMTLGKQIRAYHPDGTPADAAAVLKALSKPTAATCFPRSAPPGQEPTLDAPDPFYLRVLREDTLALVYAPREIVTPLFDGQKEPNPPAAKKP